ncbi:DUF4926 domain-containing protein [Polaromonas hydrogenivorans]|uniref:DUF4926 domain-containing protein n=1 Tax=Polaromonas hydrogenivorans TaxID=335476 RepID=A0AAU7M045_9BURK
MLNEHTQVVLVRPVPGLKPGDVGVVVHVHGQGQAYEVEFMSPEGRTLSVQTLDAGDVRAADGPAACA